MNFSRLRLAVNNMAGRPLGYGWDTHPPSALCDRASRMRHWIVLTTTEFLHFDVPRKAERPQCRDSVPVDVDFVPGQAMTGTLGMGVMIIMPAFTKGQQCHPKTVSGCIPCGESPRSPHVGGGVYQPGGMKANDRPQEDAPQQESPSAGN